MKPNPDNRKDNVDNIQNNIDMTIKNIHLANELIEKTSDQKLKHELTQKNKRRDAALQAMRREIKDEAEAKKNGFEG